MRNFAKTCSAKIRRDTYCQTADLVQSVAVFLCEHYGEYLDDFLYISKRGKRITIKIECCLIVTRMLCRKYCYMQKYTSLEKTKMKIESISYPYDTQ